MPLYTFYPHKPDGSATTFEAHELACDRTAIDRAAELLNEYINSHTVVVWEGDRQVGVKGREPADQDA